MESLFSRYKNPLVLVAVLLVQIVGLAIQVRRPYERSGDPSTRLIRLWTLSVLAPPEHWVEFSQGGVVGLWNNYVDLLHVRQQNQALQSEVDRLRLEQASLAEDASQAQRLQILLGFKAKYINKTVAAQVIGTSGSDESHLLILDKGSDAGLKRDDAVITPVGIVGRLTEVFPHSSLLLEISDATSGAGVLFKKNRLQGVLRGTPYGQIEVVDILPDPSIRPGDLVVTSGGDQIFPPGLPVGTVQKIVPDPDHSPLVNVVLQPAAHLDELNEVLVISSIVGQMPVTEQNDVATSELDQTQSTTADMLAAQLPSAIDPEAPPEELFTSLVKNFNPIAPLTPLRPEQPAQPDQFTPGNLPPAADMTPGTRDGTIRNGVEKLQRPDKPLSGEITQLEPGIVVTGNPQPIVVPGQTVPGNKAASGPNAAQRIGQAQPQPKKHSHHGWLPWFKSGKTPQEGQ